MPSLKPTIGAWGTTSRVPAAGWSAGRNGYSVRPRARLISAAGSGERRRTAARRRGVHSLFEDVKRRCRETTVPAAHACRARACLRHDDLTLSSFWQARRNRGPTRGPSGQTAGERKRRGSDADVSDSFCATTLTGWCFPFSVHSPSSSPTGRTLNKPAAPALQPSAQVRGAAADRCELLSSCSPRLWAIVRGPDCSRCPGLAGSCLTPSRGHAMAGCALARARQGDGGVLCELGRVRRVLGMALTLTRSLRSKAALWTRGLNGLVAFL